MFIQRKPRWDISCLICEAVFDPGEKYFPLSFTTNDFQNFVPPNGKVTDFNLYAEIGSNFPTLKMGIYVSPLACCLVGETANGMFLHGTSCKWEELRSMVAKIISSAGMRPKVLHTKETPQQKIIDSWTSAVLALPE